MAVKASAHITLNSVVDVQATYRYYLLRSSTLGKPSKPTANPPGGDWVTSEPTYTSGSTNSLYYVDLTVFSNNTFSYSEVSLSTAYEAAKEAYNKANNAQLGVDAVNANIQTLVTGANGESLMTQTDTGWTYNFGEAQNTIGSLVNNVSELNQETDAHQAWLNSLANMVAGLEEYTDYIRLGVIGGQPCILLGETDSDFKLVITNTDIKFMEGSAIPASISNQAMNIETAIVNKELRQGNFAWTYRSNGHYSLSLKG